MRELPQRHRLLLKGSHIVVASADRVLHQRPGSQPRWHRLPRGADSTEAEALACLSNTAADLLICSDQLERGNDPPWWRLPRPSGPPCASCAV